MADIRAKLEVAAKLANADTSFQDEIQLEESAAEDIVDQVADYFQLGESATGVVTVAHVVDE